MNKIYLLVSLLVFAVFTNLNAQVSLTATNGTLIGTYTTLKAAFDAINIGTHKGDIIIELSASTVEGATPATLLSGDADPTSYSLVTIYPTADGVSVSGNPAAGFGVVQLNGADNVIIDGDNPNTVGTNRNLSIVNTAVSTTGYTSCLRVATLAGASASADNIFIFNCNFTGNVTSGNASGITSATSSSNTSFGLYFGGKGSATSTLAAITSETADAALAGTTINNIVIDNIAVNQCARGIAFNGAATTVGSSLSITNSVIGAAGAISGYPVTAPATTVYTKGIWVAGVDAVYIALNTIQNILSYVGATSTGIELASNIGSGSVNIDANIINGVLNNGTGGTANGILVSSTGTKFTVSNNIISNIQGSFPTSAAPVVGINVATSGGIAQVIKNKISGLFNRNGGGYGAAGIYFSTAANASEISNNFVYDVMNVGASSFGTTTENATGILIGSGSSHKINHNSVHLSGVSGATATNMISCFTVSSSASASLDIRNNIFSNTVTGGSASNAHVCMYFPFTAIATGGSYIINNNAYYTGATAGLSGVAFAGASVYAGANLYDAANFNPYSTTSATNFRNWSTAAGLDNNDFASFGSTVAAPFVSATDLHITGAANRLESGGVATSITSDIDGAARGTFPDIGADEFAGTIQDLTAPLITYIPLDGTCVLGNRTLTVNIKDPSNVPVAGAGLPVLYWSINLPAGPFTPVTGVSGGGGNYNFTFGGGAVVGQTVYYYIVAQDAVGTPNVISAPSVGAGPFTANVPAATTPPTTPERYLVQTNLAPGTYNVGVAQTYPTLTAAIIAYNNSCLGGPVIFQLTDATYAGSETFPIVIGNPVASAANTLTIKPAAGVNATITGSVADGLIKFNGADYVTIDGSNNGTTSQNLTISNSNTGLFSAVIWVASASSTNGATNNVIKNTAIKGNATLTTLSGIISSGGTGILDLPAIANVSNTYENLSINTAYVGIALIGPTGGDNNNTITNCKIGSTVGVEKMGFRGIHIENQNNVVVTNNQVFGISSTDVDEIDDVTAGISVRGAIGNGVISSNIVSDIKNLTSGAWTAHGITLQSTSPNTGLNVYNNFIYDIAGLGYNFRVQDNGFGIGILTGGGYKVYYNSISINTNQINGGGISAAIFIDNRPTIFELGVGSTPVALNIRNNIFSNEQTAGSRYSIISLVPSTSFTSIDYNDYYTTGTTLGFLTSARTNLAAWQSATGGDVNSVSVIPVYTSATNLHLSGASTLNNLGTNIAGFTTDIDVDTRNATTPDMGADEFTPPNCGGVITAGTISASKTTICVTDSIVLSATGFSFGNGMVYQWQSSPDNATWTAIAGKRNPSAAIVPVSTTTYFRLTDTCTITSSPANSASVLVTVTTPSVTSTTPGSVCGLGTVTLSAVGSGGTTLRWFDVLTGGSPIATTASYVTPTINTTTTYYVEAVSGSTVGSVGPSSPTTQGGTIGTQTVSWDVGFDVIQTTTLISVDVFPIAAGGSGTLNVYNSSNTILASVPYTYTVSGGATAQTIPINLSLPPGTGYYIEDPAFTLPGSGASRNISGAVYPYTSSAINITGNGFDQTYFMCYYNWQFSSGCASAPRTPVVATVSATAALTPAASPAIICEGATSNLTSFNATYSTYSWLPSSGLSNAAIHNPVATPASTTIYTVTATNGTCTTSADVTITVNPIPSPVIINPGGPVAFCAGAGATLLTATGGSGNFFSERFEIFPIGKFTTTGTGITENLSTTYYQEGTKAVRLTYLPNLTTNLASYQVTNSINLSQYSNPVLSFQHICGLEKFFGTDYDFGYVEYSTDNGATWTPFPTSSYSGAATLLNGVVCFGPASYPDWTTQFTGTSSTPGIAPAASMWKLETIDLTPWQSSTQFMFRYAISSDFNGEYYGWLLDDIKINGQATITWSPATDLFLDAGAVTPYGAGTNHPLVYTKPTVSRSYIATAAFGSCPKKDTVDVNVTANPISIAIAASPGTTVCAGYPVNFSISSQNIQGEPNPFYTWQINGVTATGSATGGSSVGTTVTVASTANLYVGMRVNVTAGTGFFAANTRIVSITNATQFVVSAVPSIALSGATIAATASGTTVTSFSYTGLATGNVVTCILSTPSVVCVVPSTGTVTSNTLTFTVTPSTPASVSVSALPAGAICSGSSVTFTATPTNGGAAPTYEWFIGAVSQGAPSATATFTSSTLANGNIVTVKMVSNAPNCPLPNPSISTPITMTVDPAVSVHLTPNTPICGTGGVGPSTLYTATPSNGGISPLYEFFINGISQGAPSAVATLTYAPTNGDILRVVLQSSASVCTASNPDDTLFTQVVNNAPTAGITGNATYCPGVPVLLNSNATGGSGTISWYQWRLGGVNITGATSGTYTAYAAGNYDVIVKNSDSCSVISAVFAVSAAPVLMTGPYTIGEITTTATGANAGATINVASTATLVPGQPVAVTSGTGAFAAGQFTASGASAGTTINVASTTGLQVGQIVMVSSGTGIFAAGTTVVSVAVGSFVVSTAPTTALAAAATIIAVSRVASITNATQFVVSPAPVTALAAGAVISAQTCTNYISFLTAIRDLNVRTISGSCTFNVTPAFVENIPTQLALGNGTLNGLMSGKAIIFQKNGAGINPKLNSYVGTRLPNDAVPDGIWSLNGIDNVTINNIDATDVNNNVFNVTATAAAATTNITVGSTAGITIGMSVVVFSGTGAFPVNTTVASITDATHFVSSAVPSTAIAIGAVITVNLSSLMDFGYGLFKFSTTDGAQNNTISNCNITLNKVNNAVGSGPMPAGSTGILVANSIRTAAVTALTPVGAVAANSSNKFYTNTIQNCNNGIVLNGFADATPFTNADVNNDIGGGSSATGNTIFNFGGSTGALLASAGIIISNQWGSNTSYNTLNNDSTSGTRHANTLRGIFGQVGISASATISNNYITVKGGGTTTAVTGIDNAIGSTAAANTININNNIVTGSYTTATSGSWTGITNSATAANVNMNFNTVQNVTLPGTLASTFAAISNTAAIPTTLKINSNNILNNTKTTTVASSTNNATLISSGTTVLSGVLVEVNNNIITGNSVVGGNNTVAFTCILTGGASGSSVTATGNTISNNSVTGMTLTGVATLYGYSNGASTTIENISSNNINNLFVTGTSSGLHVISAIRYNTLNTAVRTVSTNTIYNLYSNAGSSANITGITSGAVATLTCSRNWIYNLFPGQSATAGSIAKGIAISGGAAGTVWNVSNNMIALDLKLAASTTSLVARDSVLTGANSVIGIEMTTGAATSNINLYFNSIRLAGYGGTGFGSSAVLHTASTTSTTAALTMTNNILQNECTPNGGFTVAYRRTSGSVVGSLANHIAGNTNLFYAGTPGLNNLIYYDAFAVAQTLAAYTGGVFNAGTVAPRDAASVSDITTFLSQTDLHVAVADNCAISNTGTSLASPLIDYDNTARAATPDIGADEFAGTGTSGTWVGVNTNWNDPINWCGGVPTATTSVIIPSPVPNYPVIPTGTTALALNITIDAGANITTTGTGLLDVKGSVTNNGILNNWAEIRLSGAVAQQFPTVASTGSINAMTRLTIANTSGGVTINKDLLIREAITPTSGAVTLNNAFITLRSVADTTARIGVVGGSFVYTGTGNFVVERYFPGNRAWRLIGAPVVKNAARTIFTSWQAGGDNTLANAGNGTYVTGPAAAPALNGFDISPANNHSLKAFNRLTSGFDGPTATKGLGLPAYPVGATASYLDTTGYFMFVRGDRTVNNPAPFNPYIDGNITVLRDTGNVKTGSIVYSLNPVATANLNYTLVGNPYASAIDFTQLVRNASVPNSFQAWDPLVGSVGAWVARNVGTGFNTPASTNVSNIIHSKQAIVVQTSAVAPAPTITFNESAKSSNIGYSLLFRPAPQPAASLIANLYFIKADGSDQLADGVLAMFNDDYSPGTDYMDAVKFTNINETFCIKDGSNYYIQDLRPFFTPNDTMLFNFAKARQFNYKLNFSLDNMLKEKNRVAYFEDRFLNTATPLNMQGNTSVNFEVNSNTASSAPNRFFITFKKVAKFNSISADVLYSDVVVNWSVENAALVSHYEIERSIDGKSFEKVGEVVGKDNGDVLNYYTLTDPSLAAGEYYYRVKAISNSHSAMDYSNVAKVKVMTEKGGLYVYPNPVTNGIIGLKMNAASVEGKYAVRLLNGTGQAVAVQQFQHTKATQAHFISYPSYVASGTYQLEVTGPDKKKAVISVAIAKK